MSGPEGSIYLGDSVYAKFNEAGQLMIFTYNGFPPFTNVIYLEPEVYSALSRFVKSEHCPWGVKS